MMTIQKEEDYDNDKIQYGTVTICYDIIRSKRIKTSEIIVDPDKLKCSVFYNFCRLSSDFHHLESWLGIHRNQLLHADHIYTSHTMQAKQAWNVRKVLYSILFPSLVRSTSRSK